MNGPVLGIDIGATGALALLTPKGVLLDCLDMPVLNDGPAGRRAVNAPLFARLVRRWAPQHAYVEFVSARPKESPVGGFASSQSRGGIEGGLGALAVPMASDAPATSKTQHPAHPGVEGCRAWRRGPALGPNTRAIVRPGKSTAAGLRGA